ncbi:MAG: hypothetical protein Q9217_006072 [Psora testacea]
MEEVGSVEHGGPWMSITGKPIDLGNQASFRVSSFERLNQLGEGTYGVVYRAKERSTSKVVALKQVRIPFEEHQNGVPITALREISILRSLKHTNIINVIDVAVGDRTLDDVYMVMEYVEQERDVKMQNILLTAKGVLKLADFGMARAYSPRPLTPGVVTIWYRAPEILLGTKYYTPAIDIWSAGLVLAELLLSAPCLTGETPIEQLSLIIKLLGSPTVDDLAALSGMGCPEMIQWRREGFASGRPDNIERKFRPNTSPETVVFLKGLLQWDPRARWTAVEALGSGRSRYSTIAERWWNESPRAIGKELLPTYPEIRNQAEGHRLAEHGKDKARVDEGTKSSENGDYVFHFVDDISLRRPSKKPRAK